MSSMVDVASTAERVDAFNAKLEKRAMRGFWQRSPAPKQAVEPWIWRWRDIYASIEEAATSVPLSPGKFERRTLFLVNPTLGGLDGTSRSLLMSVQVVNPGETAETHRHTPSALRFVVQGSGAYTVSDGEQMVMETGDLLIQPTWTWHGHANYSDQPIIWLDGLDGAIVRFLDANFYEDFPDGFQGISREDGSGRVHLGFRPAAGDSSRNSAVAFNYKWRDTLALLGELAAQGSSDPYDGVLLRYVNPMTGGPTFSTMSCEIQLLRPGEETRPHRHTGSTIYHVARGAGITIAEGTTSKRMEWDERDCFVVPSWHWHSHKNYSASEPAILFSMNDIPLIKAAGLYREEQGG